MRTFRSAFLVAVLASCLGSAGVARAQAIPFDIEVGYRFLTLSGSEESYRSQVNEHAGFLVRSIHIGEDGSSSAFPIDRLRIDGKAGLVEILRATPAAVANDPTTSIGR